MEELLMECEEEELQPWQRKLKAVVVDDDDELIFVGEIVSAKTPTSNSLNRVNPGSSPRWIQNGSPGRGAVSTFKSTGPQYKTLASPAGTMAVSPVYQGVSRPTTSSVVLQPLSRPLSVSGSTQSVPRPIPASLSPQQSSRPISGVSQTICRAATIPVTSQPISRNVNIPIGAQSGPRPVATVTAQPVIANQGYILSSPPVTQKNSPGTMFGVQQKEIKQYPSTPTLPLTANANVKENVFANKRPAMQEVSVVPPKISKPIEAVKGNSSTCTFVTVTSSPSQLNSFKGSTAGSIQVKNGTPFPSACPKCSINFNLLDSLKNHMKYCCPDMLNTLFAGAVKTESSSSPRYEEGKLIMLVSDFYYGKHDGDLDLVQKEKKTNTTFKCFSCGKVLKNNVRFMNHMKHHLELEKQNSESWESHTTCHHCYRQFPTPFQLQCHIESSHTLYESTTICKICELSYENEQVLLQHMKDNHKPGEMPYVCQVCSYRSSLFSDVENHFRTVHENTKALLCPFCLKVVRIGTPYMQHYMKHQRKGIHRCAKCRLQFLTSKEKMDHRTQHHRTFKKPKQLEGLPPGTKVTIRATVGSLHTESSTTSPVSTSSATSLETCSKTKNMNTKVQTAAVKSSTPKSQPNASNSKLQTNLSNPKTPSNSGSSKALVHSSNQKTPLNSSVSKTQSNASNSKTQPNSSQSKLQPNASQTRSQPNPPKKCTVPTTMKKKKNFNTALKNLRNHFGTQKCIECYAIVKDFASHFSTHVNCSVCRYSTSCSKAYSNHMVSYHSNRSSKRFASLKKPLKPRRGLTTVCLNCDFLTGDSGIDAMAKHMSENPHSCQIVFENDVGKHEKKLQDETFSEKNLLHSEKPSGLAELNVENASTSAHESKIEDEASLEAKIESSGTEITEDADEKDTKSRAPLKNENYPISDAQGTCLDELTSATTASEIDEKIDLVVNDLQQELASDKTDLKIHQHTANAQSSDPKKEENLAEIDEKRSTELVSGDVTFEQFLRRDEPESVCSDFSDQGSIHLEPLTPSEVLEFQATEILQKGGISPSTKKDIDSSEHTDDIPLESSPCEGEASTSLNITSEESRSTPAF